MELSGFSGVGEVSCKLDVNVMCKLHGNLLALNLEKLEPISRSCPYGISLVEFTKVGKILFFFVDFLKWSNEKVLHMETKKTKLPKKLIRL